MAAEDGVGDGVVWETEADNRYQNGWMAEGQLFHNVCHFDISVFIFTHCLILTMFVKVVVH